MARLFITPREIDFIADLNKEIIKDVMGQKVYYYKVREDLTNVHDVYEEAPDKVFNPPIEVDARIDWNPAEVRTNMFGQESYFSITAFIQMRDLIDKDIEILAGDFFSYGTTFFEVTSVIVESTIFGQVEHTTGVRIFGQQAREGLIDKMPKGPLDEVYSDPDAIQDTFVQQRGFEKNRLGETGDVRSLQEKGITEEPISGPAEVSPRGGNEKENEIGGIDSSFYADS